MFRQLKIPILGLVENMSFYACPPAGIATTSSGTAARRPGRESQGIPFLGAIPLHAQVRVGGDAGLPAVIDPDAPAAVREAFDATARELARQISIHNLHEARDGHPRDHGVDRGPCLGSGGGPGGRALPPKPRGAGAVRWVRATRGGPRRPESPMATSSVWIHTLVTAGLATGLGWSLVEQRALARRLETVELERPVVAVGTATADVAARDAEITTLRGRLEATEKTQSTQLGEVRSEVHKLWAELMKAPDGSAGGLPSAATAAAVLADASSTARCARWSTAT